MPIVLKSGSLNLLETSGPVQASNRIALPLPLPYRLLKIIQLLRNYDNVMLLIDTDSNVNHFAITVKICAP